MSEKSDTNLSEHERLEADAPTTADGPTVRLPTLYSLQEAMHQYVRKSIRDRIRQKVPMAGMSPSHIVHDGKQSEITRADGSQDETPMESHSAYYKGSIHEHVHFELDKFEFMLDQMADQLSDSISNHFISVLDETTKKSGNVFDGSGKKLEDSLLDVLEQLPASESESDQPRMIVSPAMAEKLKELQTKARDPEIDKRFLEVMEKKRLERISREAGRKLVG